MCFACRLEKGTTYKSYIIYRDRTALVDASHEKFRGLHMSTLKKELQSKGRTLDNVMVSSTEPDHSGRAFPSRVNIPSPLCPPHDLHNKLEDSWCGWHASLLLLHELLQLSLQVMKSTL